MRKSILFFVSILFYATTALSENHNQDQLSGGSKSDVSAVNSLSSQSDDESVQLAESASVDSVKTPALKSDTAHVDSVSDQIVIEKGRYLRNGKALKQKALRMLLNSDPKSAGVFSSLKHKNLPKLIGRL